MVTDGTNYDILIGQHVLYPFGFGLDSWTEEAWTQLSWWAGDGRRELIFIAFTTGVIIAHLSLISGCGAQVDELPYGSTLSEELLAFMRSIEDQQKVASKDALVRHPNDPFPLWHDFPELLRRYEDIIFFLALTTPILPDTPSTLAHPIVWRCRSVNTYTIYMCTYFVFHCDSFIWRKVKGSRIILHFCYS
jgi:hypothetical protein